MLVQRRLLLDLLLVALPLEVRLLNLQNEVLGHLEAADRTPHPQCDLLLATQGPLGMSHCFGNFLEFLFRGRQQSRAFGGAAFGQKQVAAGDETLAGKVRAADLRQSGLLEKRKLDDARIGKLADLAGAQCADPLQPLDGANLFVNVHLGDHAAAAHHHDAMQSKSADAEGSR